MKQVGGTHYETMVIQPIDFIVSNQIPYREGNAIKYICRYKRKNGIEDLKKAIHYLQMIIDDIGIKDAQVNQKEEFDSWDEFFHELKGTANTFKRLVGTGWPSG